MRIGDCVWLLFIIYMDGGWCLALVYNVCGWVNCVWLLLIMYEDGE